MSSYIESQITKNNIDLTFELFSALSDGNTLNNIVFSPFSVLCCIALAHAGARGETAEEIAKGIKLISNDKAEVGNSFNFIFDTYHGSNFLKIANKIYVKTGHSIKKAFSELVKTRFHSEAEEINFSESESASLAINQWVASKTNGKITKLISSTNLNHYTRLVLLNAIHFKEEWKIKFDKEKTVEDVFWINEERSTEVPMMNRKANFRYGVFDDLDCKGLEMEYKNSNLSMFIILPNKRNGLKDVAEKLKNIDWIELNKRTSLKEVLVKFPKFKVEFSVELSDVFKKMGIRKMFSPEAEFEDILESSEPLFVSTIIHKAFIEVNEEGTEAAAATGTRMVRSCAIMPLEFNADHPFLYIIWDKKTVLFAGSFVYAEPTTCKASTLKEL